MVILFTIKQTQLGGSMVQLIEPDGTLGNIVTKDYAIVYCRSNPGWSWEELNE